ncbi:MATE family efflux transporter [Clostridium sp. AM58-1XD]|uniref:MATE family efflux transporter n=1 Tax=Clostridium sp. AM58-1XD TaxID=2292307 RepID=UPI000E467F52|nr:MATE family efflux transporter [Clostridium sp. AM58-1XD]RGY95856.1 MATE family efflux transporter [Clostridium sp. AM58-1XD]
MGKIKTQEEKYRQMIETPVSKLIPGLAVPTIISMLVTSIYNMADTFFVSQIGTSASGAVGVIFSAMAMIQALGFGLGMGSGNYISRSLGNKNMGEAGKAASTAFFTAMLLGIVIAVAGNVFLRPLVVFLGATKTIVPFAEDYAKYILMAAPFMMCSFVMNNILRAQGNAMYAMVGITAGGILNMILDPIFIFGMGLGTAGAALATGLSQIISFLILLFQSNLRNDCLSFRFRDFAPSFKMYGKIFHAGLPSFARQSIASISVIILNVAAGPFGDAAIAAMSIVNRFMLFINSTLIGFGQGFQPVCGFNFGARRYDRVLEAYWFCVKVAVILLTTLGVVFIGFSRGIITLFRREDLEVIEIGTLALRVQLLTLPIQAWVTMVNMLSQSIGYGFRSALVSIGRQGIFLIPALLIMPPVWGILGIQMAQPVADVCTFVLACVVVKGILKELNDMRDAVGKPA